MSLNQVLGSAVRSQSVRAALLRATGPRNRTKPRLCLRSMCPTMSAAPGTPGSLLVPCRRWMRNGIDNPSFAGVTAAGQIQLAMAKRESSSGRNLMDVPYKDGVRLRTMPSLHGGRGTTWPRPEKMLGLLQAAGLPLMLSMRVWQFYKATRTIFQPDSAENDFRQLQSE